MKLELIYCEILEGNNIGIHTGMYDKDNVKEYIKEKLELLQSGYIQIDDIFKELGLGD